MKINFFHYLKIKFLMNFLGYFFGVFFWPLKSNPERPCTQKKGRSWRRAAPPAHLGGRPRYPLYCLAKIHPKRGRDKLHFFSAPCLARVRTGLARAPGCPSPTESSTSTPYLRIAPPSGVGHVIVVTQPGSRDSRDTTG